MMDEIRGQLASGNRYRASTQEVEILDSAGNSMRKLRINDITGVARSGQSVYIDDNAGNRLELITASVLDAEQLENKVRAGLAAQTPAGSEYRNDPLPGSPPPQQRDGFPNIGPGQQPPPNQGGFGQQPPPERGGFPPQQSPSGFPQQTPQPAPGQPGQPRKFGGRRMLFGCLIAVGVGLLLCLVLSTCTTTLTRSNSTSSDAAPTPTTMRVNPTSTSTGGFQTPATPTQSSSGSFFPTVTSAANSTNNQPSANDVRVRLGDGASADITTSGNRTTRVSISRVVDNVSGGNTNQAPASGNRWWGAEIGLNATGRDSVFIGEWTLRTTDGREYQRSIISGVGQDIGYGQLQAGQSKQGTIIFEIPSNARVESVRYDPDPFNPGVVYFEAQ